MRKRGGAEKYKFKKQKGFCFHTPHLRISASQQLRVTTSFSLNHRQSKLPIQSALPAMKRVFRAQIL